MQEKQYSRKCVLEPLSVAVLSKFRSTIIEHVTQHFRNDTCVIVIYFYCDYKDIHKRAPRQVLEALIADICRQSPGAMAYVGEILSKYREFKSSPALNTLFSIFRWCLEFQLQTFVVIDALDELNGREELLRVILELSKSGSRLNLPLLSRKEKGILQELHSLPQIGLQKKIRLVMSNCSFNRASTF